MGFFSYFNGIMEQAGRADKAAVGAINRPLRVAGG